MTPKPIFIIRSPFRNFQGEGEMFEATLNTLRQELTDYHVLLVADRKLETTEFELYNAPDATKTDIQVIQNMVLEKMKELEKNIETIDIDPKQYPR
jgi:hypothetical protein